MDKTRMSKPNRENFFKLADTLYSDVVVGKRAMPVTAGQMLEDYLEGVIKSNGNK